MKVVCRSVVEETAAEQSHTAGHTGTVLSLLTLSLSLHSLRLRVVHHVHSGALGSWISLLVDDLLLWWLLHVDGCICWLLGVGGSVLGVEARWGRALRLRVGRIWGWR